MKIMVVGVCASGKSTLVGKLQEKGYDACNIAQEHSCVKRLWLKRKPDLLIVLDATLMTVQKRRRERWTQEHIDIQHDRLSDARSHADLYLLTDKLTPIEVLSIVVDFIESRQCD
ncbi:hypothetical protein [Pectinatus frisingensis]|jgi:deoxyadenosine/deoxycytidine kinase|uniref:hypothetical protein n=1 Tax=Pectinatus frisingensis TaxID=865 RepID=UPI0015F71CCD|nr:hypothetical protein [Pectinatus frisingensis]